MKLYKPNTIFDLKVKGLNYKDIPVEYPNTYVVRTAQSDFNYLYRLGYSSQVEKMVLRFTKYNPLAEICGVSYVPESNLVIAGINKKNNSGIYGWYMEDDLVELCKKFSFITYKEFIEVKLHKTLFNLSSTSSVLTAPPSINSVWFNKYK